MKVKNIFLAASIILTMGCLSSCTKDDNKPTSKVQWVDLGLPSGLLWASHNVGATAPEESGDYFAWGETTPKSTYNLDTYTYYSDSSMTKYISSDGLTTLQPEDDAATANWGDGVRTPTKAEWDELLSNTTVEWTTENGVNGRRFTAPNGNAIFLPTAGYGWYDTIDDVGNGGYYWSASLNDDHRRYAWSLCFDPDDYFLAYFYYRYVGFPVRAVRASQN